MHIHKMFHYSTLGHILLAHNRYRELHENLNSDFIQNKRFLCFIIETAENNFYMKRKAYYN